MDPRVNDVANSTQNIQMMPGLRFAFGCGTTRGTGGIFGRRRETFRCEPLNGKDLHP